MDEDIDQDPIKAEFRKRRRRQLLLAVLIVPPFLAFSLSGGGGQGTIAGISKENFVPVGVVMFVGAVAFSLWNWRCPACRHSLGKRWHLKFCSDCGAQLHD